jgi:hypothetical protein
VIRDRRWARRRLGEFGAPVALVVCALAIAMTDQLWRLDCMAYNGFLRAWERAPAWLGALLHIFPNLCLTR